MRTIVRKPVRVTRQRAVTRYAVSTLATILCASVPTWAQSGTGAAPASAEGKQVFTQGTVPTCAVCHSLSDAGATGNIGPNLDDMKPDAARVRRVVKEGIGSMPPFGGTLSDAQIDAVSQYVARATGGRQTPL